MFWQLWLNSKEFGFSCFNGHACAFCETSVGLGAFYEGHIPFSLLVIECSTYCCLSVKVLLSLSPSDYPLVQSLTISPHHQVDPNVISFAWGTVNIFTLNPACQSCRGPFQFQSAYQIPRNGQQIPFSPTLSNISPANLSPH